LVVPKSTPTQRVEGTEVTEGTGSHGGAEQRRTLL
jgi:hypothetical protein